MKPLAEALSTLEQAQILELERVGTLSLNVAGTEVALEREDVDIYSEDIPGWLVANEGTLTIALDITVTDELRLEGTARELINRIQNLRKQSGFEVSDRIRVLLPEDEELAKVLALYGSYIAREVQAVSIDQRMGFTPTLELDIDDRIIPIFIEQANN